MSPGGRTGLCVGDPMAPRFFIGPARWLAPDSGLTATERLVLAVLCQWTSKDTGECFPSIATVAAHAAISETSVRKAMGGLVKHGAVSIRRRKDEQGVWQSNIYLILGFDPPPEAKKWGTSRGEVGVPQQVKGGTSNDGGTVPREANPNVVTTDTPLDVSDDPNLTIETLPDGTQRLGSVIYRDRSRLDPPPFVR